MRCMRHIVSGFGATPWIMAGALLVLSTAPASAQPAAPAPIEIGTASSIAPPVLPAATVDVAGAATRPSTMPSAAVGSGPASGGTGPLGLGALVGAGVAAAAALRERFKRG